METVDSDFVNPALARSTIRPIALAGRLVPLESIDLAFDIDATTSPNAGSNLTVVVHVWWHGGKITRYQDSLESLGLIAGRVA
jgi:hypothetical protein